MSMLLLALLFSVRPVDPIATETLDFAMTRSDVVRTLIGTLERSNVIVHIQSSRELPGGISGVTRFVVSRGGYRYLRITIGAEMPTRMRAALLAHELQHACEIAESMADDVEGLTKLFLTAGRRSGDYFETAAAVRIERTVREEFRTLQAEPIVKFHH